MLYLIIIGGSMLLIIQLNVVHALPAFTEHGAMGVALCTLLGTLSVIIWDGIQALLVRRLMPRALFRPGKRVFNVPASERAFYRRLHVNEWKDLVPELGGFSGFRKSQRCSPNDPIYLERFLLESNYGVIIHLLNALLGGLILCLPWCSELSIGLPIALVNALLSLLPVIVLRFNTAPLYRLYRRALQKAA
jgi:hypothetical protein